MMQHRGSSAAATAGPGGTPTAAPTGVKAPNPGEFSRWTVRTSVTGWCVTCGTEVDFDAPSGFTPVDLAADERACVWCGEALVVSVGILDRPRRDSPTGADVLVG